MSGKKQILLISPPKGKSQLGKVPMPPLGLASIAAVLEEDGHKVEILDSPLYDIERAELESEIRKRRPDLVGITGTTWTRFEQFDAARASKKALPDIPVVLGGPHVTFSAINTIEKLPDVDFVIKGEGETPLRKLVDIYPDLNKYKEIPGIACRNEDKIIDNPIGDFISDLDSLPVPARHLLDIETYKQTLFGKKATTVMTSRGCPIFCSFCSTSVMWGEKNRRRSPSLVLDEIEGLLHRYGLEAIWFFDDTLTLNRSHIVGILDEIEKRKLKFIWYCEIRVNTVDYDLLKRMYNLGCRFVSFGVESGSPEVLKRIHKGINLVQVRKVLDWCKEIGIYTKAFFMFGLPDETYEDGMMTVHFIKDVKDKINDVALSAGCSIMPGTEVERYAIGKGLIQKDFDWTKVVYYPENRMNNRPIAVPTLLQSQLGLNELNRLKFEYYGKGAVNWHNIKSRLKNIKSPSDILNLAKLGFVFFGYFLNGLKRKKRRDNIEP
jgi:anaerobic magnesium-protoporphyrin IX monomethyl ester cyclase